MKQTGGRGSAVKRKGIIALLVLVGCMIAAGLMIKGKIRKVTGLHNLPGICTRIAESHGGFFGDGTTIYHVKIWGDGVLAQIEEDDHWRELPLSEPLESYVYGLGTVDFSFPEVEHGYYFFWDRHSKSTDPYDETDLNHRGSHNFTLVIYDTDKNMIYYLALDT